MYTPEQIDEDAMCEEISDRIEAMDSFMKAESVKLAESIILLRGH